MKGRGQLVMGGLAGLVVGASVGSVLGFNKGRDTGYSEGQSHAEGTRLTYGSSQYAEGSALGFEEGLEKGRTEGFSDAGIFDHTWLLPDLEGNLYLGGINVMIGGWKYEDYKKGKMTAPDAQILCDLRGIAQPSVNDNTNKVFNRRNLQNLVWHEGLPKERVTIYTTQRVKDLLEKKTNRLEFTETERIMFKYIPPESDYKIEVVPEEELGRVDFTQRFLNNRNRSTGLEYTPEQVKPSDKTPYGK